MESATLGQQSANEDDVEDESDESLLGSDTPARVPRARADVDASADADADADADEEANAADAGDDEGELDLDDLLLDPTIQQAMEQSDQQSQRKRDPEY
jgi:hypothetical protein